MSFQKFGFLLAVVTLSFEMPVLPVSGAEGEQVVPVSSPLDREEVGGFAWSVGGDFRLRQEIMDNIPGNPNEIGGAYSAKSGKNLNWLRGRPRLWSRFGSEEFNLYLRVADEMREHFVENGIPRDKRSYNPPDELILDNLYLTVRGLLDDRLDLRIGRQDFIDKGPVYGAGRLMMDGTAYDGSRSAYFDSIRMILRLTEKSELDAFAICNKGENELHIGRPTRSPRAINAIDPRDSDEMDEFGGGLYLRSREFGNELPFELYYIYKRETSYHLLGKHKPGRYTHTVGGRFIPQLSETLGAEFELAGQSGQKDSGASVAGAMGFAGLVYKPRLPDWRELRPFLKLSCYALSGDRKRQDAGNRDTGWNPLWGRWPQDSEMLVYGPLYGLGYWSNMIYPSLGGGLEIAPHHKLNLYAGPMFTAVNDGLGGGTGSDKGILGVIRYDFPIWKNSGGSSGISWRRDSSPGITTSRIVLPTFSGGRSLRRSDPGGMTGLREGLRRFVPDFGSGIPGLAGRNSRCQFKTWISGENRVEPTPVCSSVAGRSLTRTQRRLPKVSHEEAKLPGDRSCA